MPREAKGLFHRGGTVFVAAIVLGFVFGGANQYLGSRVMVGSHFALGPWATAVSLMSAPWLAFPFVFGSTQVRPLRAAMLGLVATLAALAGYFVLMWSPLEGVALSDFLGHWRAYLLSQRMNIFGGLVTGPLFGLLGQRWRANRSWASASLVVGAFCFEPLARRFFGHLPPPNFVWEIEVASGLFLALVFTYSGLARTRGSIHPAEDHSRSE